jgi:hypothetical protein
MNLTQYIYIITTVTWSEESDHVELTGADHQIARDTKHRVWSDDPRLSTRRDLTFLDQVTVIMINLLYTPILNEKNVKIYVFKVNILFQMIKNTNKQWDYFCAYHFHCDIVNVFNKKRSVYALWRHQFQRVPIRNQKTTV